MNKDNPAPKRRRRGDVRPDSASDAAAIDHARDTVEQRAYERFLARGGTHGSDVEDWLEAERDVLGISRQA